MITAAASFSSSNYTGHWQCAVSSVVIFSSPVMFDGRGAI